MYTPIPQFVMHFFVLSIFLLFPFHSLHTQFCFIWFCFRRGSFPRGNWLVCWYWWTDWIPGQSPGQSWLCCPGLGLLWLWRSAFTTRKNRFRIFRGSCQLSPETSEGNFCLFFQSLFLNYHNTLWSLNFQVGFYYIPILFTWFLSYLVSSAQKTKQEVSLCP